MVLELCSRQCFVTDRQTIDANGKNSMSLLRGETKLAYLYAYLLVLVGLISQQEHML